MGTRAIRAGASRSWLATQLAAFLLAGCASTGRVAVAGPAVPTDDDPLTAPDAAPQGATRVRLLTLNVAMLPGPLGRNNVARAERIATRLVATPAPDVIVLLEVFDEPARRVFARRLAPTHPWIVSKAQVRGGLREDSGLFLASRLPIVERGLPRAAFHPFRARGPATEADYWVAKGVLGVELRAGPAQSLCLLAAHLQADDRRIGEHAAVRARQLAEVDRFARTFVAGVPSSRRRSVLLVGDLNVRGEAGAAGALRPTPEYRALLARLGHPRDLFREQHPSLPGHTWNIDPLAPGASSRQPAQRLDYAFTWPARLTGGVAAAVHSTAIRTVALGGGLTDHAGLALDARLGPPRTVRAAPRR
ncbi:MAG: endonuclease/exonuclease/phosphatase family protein [Planctomycetota bacterium]|nr:endonuclease/exonuclease/phosphatase family protein [Planctomycetota bacterium]